MYDRLGFDFFYKKTYIEKRMLKRNQKVKLVGNNVKYGLPSKHLIQRNQRPSA